MKLTPWRGNNVLITDSSGGPVLVLNQHGNVAVADAAEDVSQPLQEISTLVRLATSIALWIEWTAIERDEFRAQDIHPQLRAFVARLAPRFVSRGREAA